MWGRQGLSHLVLIDGAAGPSSHYQLVRLHPAHCHRHKPVVHMRNFQLRCYCTWARRQANLAGDGGIAGAQARQDADDGGMQRKDPGWHLGEGRWGWGRDRAGLAGPPSQGWAWLDPGSGWRRVGRHYGKDMLQLRVQQWQIR